MDWEKLKTKVRNDFFLSSYSSRMDEVWKEVYKYVKEESDITGIENCSSFENHLTEDKSGIGYYCVMGGDWEDPTAFVLFINEDEEVWIKIVKENVGKMESHLSKEKFVEEVKNMSDFPIISGSECFGKLNFEENK